jgi:hypothetical protein
MRAIANGNLPGNWSVVPDMDLRNVAIGLGRAAWGVAIAFVAACCQNGGAQGNAAKLDSEHLSAAPAAHRLKAGDSAPVSVKDNSASERAMGKARAEFFRAITEQYGNESDDRNHYVGYGAHFANTHSTMYWPVGRADEVIFHLKLYGKDHYLTCWKRVANKPKRMWQVHLVTDLQRGIAADGPLATNIGREKCALPLKSGKVVVQEVQRATAWAVYTQVPVIDLLRCSVLGENGVLSSSAEQDFAEAESEGFCILPDESKALHLP